MADRLAATGDPARRRRVGAVRLAEGARAVSRRDARRARLAAPARDVRARCSRWGREPTGSSCRFRCSTTASEERAPVFGVIAGLRAAAHDVVSRRSRRLPARDAGRCCAPLADRARRAADGAASRRLHEGDAARARGARRARRALAQRRQRDVVHAVDETLLAQRQHARWTWSLRPSQTGRGRETTCGRPSSSGRRRARDTPADRWSDLDILLFVDDPGRLRRGRAWVESFGSPVLTFLEPTAFGGRVERRVLYETGEDVDFPLLEASRWRELASMPEAATVLARGYRVLHDELGLGDRARGRTPAGAAGAPRTRLRSPSSRATSGTTRSGRRRSCAAARSSPRLGCLDGYLKARLVTLLEWHARAVDPTVDTGTRAASSSAGLIPVRWRRSSAHTRTTTCATSRERCGRRSTSSRASRRRRPARLGLAARARPSPTSVGASRRSSPIRGPRLRSGRDTRAPAGSRCSPARRRLRWRRRGDAGRHGHDDSAAETAEVRVYLLRDGKVWPVLREVDTTGGMATAAMRSCSRARQSRRRRSSDSRPRSPTTARIAEVAVEDGVADGAARRRSLLDAALAQVVYTLTQFPTVERVDDPGTVPDACGLRGVDARDPRRVAARRSRRSRARCARPAPRTRSRRTSTTSSPTPTARSSTTSFVTATSGSGTRGTFDFTTEPYTVPFDGVGSLIVFELSAKDGSRINLVEIPLRMTR